MRYTLIAFITAFTTITLWAKDAHASQDTSRRCYTGIASDGHANASVLVDQDVLITSLNEQMPEISDDQGKPYATIKWSLIPQNLRVTVEQLATINGKALLRAIYRDPTNEKSSSHNYVAAFLFQVGYSVRPFFVIYLDEDLEAFDSDLVVEDGKPLRLILTTSMSGSGHYHSIYEFTFRKGRPLFEGRTDTGRHIEEPEVVK